MMGKKEDTDDSVFRECRLGISLEKSEGDRTSEWFK